MLGLPKSTEYNKRVTKKKFYEKLSINSKLRQVFIDQIQSIRWANKLAPGTINLAQGKEVEEIEILVVRLEGTDLDKRILPLIDRGIPYHTVFLMEHEGIYQALAAYKEISSKSNPKVGSYYHTGWMPESELPLKIVGRDLDMVYENFLRQIAGDTLKPKGNETLRESIVKDAQRQKLKREINRLEKKASNEKQMNKKFELYDEIRKLNRELSRI